MDEKKIEPTEEMVDEAANMLSLHATGMSLRFQDGADKHTYRHRARVALRVALNRPAAPGLFTDEDALRAAREEGWDQATRWIDSYQGGPNGRTSSARSANPYRPALTLPTEDGAVIVPAEGHEFIEATICGETHYARAALRSWVGDWYAAWRAGERKCGLAASGDITPGTWKVADQ